MSELHPVQRVLRQARRNEDQFKRIAAKAGLRVRKSRGTTPSLYVEDGTGRIVWPAEWAGLDQYPLACHNHDYDDLAEFLGVGRESGARMREREMAAARPRA